MYSFSKIVDNVLGFLVKYPLYKTLQKMCVVQITAIGYSFYLLQRLIDFFIRNADLSDPATVAAFFAFATTLFTTTWVALNSILNTMKSDKGGASGE